MAVIKQISTGNRHILYPGFMVGRRHASSLRLANRMVSGEHASFRWTGAVWEIHDLASSNGTFVDGERLEQGEHRPVIKGSRLAFGDTTDVFEMEDDSPPEPVAHTDAGDVVFGEDGVLALPDAKEPELLIHLDRAGRWAVARLGQDSHLLQSGETLRCRGRAYRLTLPVSWERTWQPDEEPLSVDRIGLRFFEYDDDRFVDITIIHDRGEIELPPRVHNRVLLELARQRLEDQQDSRLSEPQHGWMNVNDLLEFCEITELQLNLYVYRARAQLSQAGVLDHHALIARRHRAPTDGRRQVRQLRLGVSRLEFDME